MLRTAVVAHGSGSTVDFVRRAFDGPLRAAGYELVTFDDRSGDVDALAGRMGELADSSGASLVGGVSLGAHAAVRVASTRPHLSGALLALPAWTGSPGAVAALSALAADEVELDGLSPVLARLEPYGWVGAELALAWPSYGQEALVAALRATARSAGPSEAELSALAVPAGVVALAGDPYHPLDVARRWVELVPRAALEVVDGSEVAADPAALGRAALAALGALGALGPGSAVRSQVPRRAVEGVVGCGGQGSKR